MSSDLLCISENMQKFVDWLRTNHTCPEFSDRNAVLSWTYDGKTIALKKPKDIHSDSRVLAYFRDYDAIKDVEYLSDHLLLHEVCHWLCVSDLDQHYFPEYGLRLCVNLPYAVGTLADGFIEDGITGQWIKWETLRLQKDNIIDFNEQLIQEFVVQKLCCYFGIRFNMSAVLTGCDFTTWEEYYIHKDAIQQVIETPNKYDEVQRRLSIFREQYDLLNIHIKVPEYIRTYGEQL